MTNWCSNHLGIEGPEDKLAQFIERLGEDKTLTFGKFISCPEELLKIQVGGCNIGGEDVYEWIDGENGPEVLSEEYRAELVSKYGYSNWYLWKDNNWGCKWEIDPSDLYAMPGQKDGIYFLFNSAWAPPIDFVKYLEYEFPELRFSLHYSEGSMSFYGSYEFGENTEHSGGFWKEECFDEDWEDNVLPEVLEFLNKYGLHPGG